MIKAVQKMKQSIRRELRLLLGLTIFIVLAVIWFDAPRKRFVEGFLEAAFR